ncbi:S49 family peptidase [Pseudoalteromonas sp. XMcav11-Q]|uniref:S49 family peptidase n=1 Tax=Pseudoalteromonas sp. XMcav11-Q TaxID=3136665 RepID=UPI0032C43474
MFKKKSKKNKAIAMISIVNNVSEKDTLNMLFKIRALPSNSHEIKAIILRISSSGGSLGAAESLVEGLQFVKQELDIPVIGLVTDSALSSAFYIAMACDKVVASPSSLIGNMGAIYRKFNISSLLEQLGVEYEVVSSGVEKDSLNYFSTNKDEKSSITTVIKNNHDNFIDSIKKFRPIDINRLKILENGEVINAKIGHELGYIDYLGGLFSAIKIACELAQEPSLPIISLDTSLSKTNGVSIFRKLINGVIND